MATKGLIFGQTNPRCQPTSKQLKTDITISKEQDSPTAIFTSSLINTTPKLISSISQNKKKTLSRLISNRSSLKMITDELLFEKSKGRNSRPSIPGLKKDLKKYICHPQKRSLIQSVYIDSKDRQFETSVVSPSRADSFSSSSEGCEDDNVVKGSTLPLEKQMKSHFRQKEGINTGESDLQNVTVRSILKASSSILNCPGEEKMKYSGIESLRSKKSHFFGKSKSVRFGRKILIFKYHPDSSIAEKDTKDSGKKNERRKKSLREIRESWFRNLKKR